MIPLKLEISNFLSYRQTAVLDYTGIHLACISGANGAGKSSILEAMTWALFGKSRSRSDEDVINRLALKQGDAAEVRFTFGLESNVYRVIRRKRANGRTQLEFQLATDAGQSQWKTLSEGKLRETEQAIENTLRMSYDVFTNASFFLQGKADEFTNQTAARRKEILAELLGVGRWNAYKEIVSERRKQAKNDLYLLDARRQETEEELGRQAQREAELAAEQARARQVAAQLTAQEALLREMQRTAEILRQQQQLVENHQATLERAQRQALELATQLTRRQGEQAEHQVVAAQEGEISAEYAAWQRLEVELQQWNERAQAWNALQQRKRPHELAIESARSQLLQQQRSLTAQADSVRAMQSERQSLAEAMTQRQTGLTRLEAEIAELAAQEQAYHQAQSVYQQLAGQRQLLAQAVNQLQSQADSIAALRQEHSGVAANLAEATVALERLQAQLAELNAQREQLAEIRGEKTALEAEQPRLEEQGKKTRQRLERLAEDTSGHCPLCGQELTPLHRQQVLADLEVERAQLAEHYRANRLRLQTVQTDMARREQSIQQLGRVERDHQLQQQRQAKSQARLEEIERAVAEWEAGGQAERLAEMTRRLADDAAIIAQLAEVERLAAAVSRKEALDRQRLEHQRALSAQEARLAEIDRAAADWVTTGEPTLALLGRQLAEAAYAPGAHAALADLEAQAAALGYAAETHAQVRDQRQALAAAPERFRALTLAQAGLRTLVETVADLARQRAEAGQHGLEQMQQYETAQAQLTALQADSADIRPIEHEVQRLREEMQQLQRRVGVAEQKLAVLDTLRRAGETLSAERITLTLLLERLERLERACSHNGVQALLIEHALPEIENDANDILERLTGGRMRVRFETQRALKTRDEKIEALDIRIEDDFGDRPYENFSGGEQFRINFAIRLALSRLLAKRAGARLQTLVIDEGFGSQDPDGRQRLVEAINSIQADFHRILVITHLDELRDAFPTRIEVTKTRDGSSIVVS